MPYLTPANVVIVLPVTVMAGVLTCPVIGDIVIVMVGVLT